MARLTIEDCVAQVPNRFELIRLTTLRAKQLRRGARALVRTTNGEVVTALRELGAGLVRPCHDEPTAGKASLQTARGTRSGGERRRASSQSQPRRTRSVLISSADPSPPGFGAPRHPTDLDASWCEEDLVEEDGSLDLEEFLEDAGVY